MSLPNRFRDLKLYHLLLLPSCLLLVEEGRGAVRGQAGHIAAAEEEDCSLMLLTATAGAVAAAVVLITTHKTV